MLVPDGCDTRKAGLSPLSGPRSHCSAPARLPSPHTGGRHRLSQKSSSKRLPSSQPSRPCSTKPSPQTAFTQLERQASPSSRLPSSHCSGASTIPSPHFGGPQLPLQPSPSVVFPSSQNSTPCHSTPSPQRA